MNKIIRVIILIYSMLIISCSSNEALKDSLINGVWQKWGYGEIIEINDSLVNVFDITAISALHRNTISRNDFEMKGIMEKSSKDTLYIKSGITIYKYHRIQGVPTVNSDSLLLNNASYNFDVFWYTFKENYAFFETRNVNWDSIYSIFKPQITTSTTDLELYDILKKTAATLNDGHVSVRASEEIMKLYKESLLKNKNHSPNEKTEPSINIGTSRTSIINQYIDTPSSYGKDTEGEGLCSWGKINTKVGYIQVNSMMLFADYNIPDSLSVNDYLSVYVSKMKANKAHEKEEVKAMKKLMDSIISQLEGQEGIILDLRFNGGGFDPVALEILSHFTSKEILAFSKKARLNSVYTEKQNISIVPSEVNSNAKLFILTSHLTASAAEILVLGSLELDHSIRIGSNTMGIFSDILEKKLPNGWKFCLSNEVYLDNEEFCYENVGITPNIVLHQPINRPLSDTKDAAVEYVIKQFNEINNYD